MKKGLFPSLSQGPNDPLDPTPQRASEKMGARGRRRRCAPNEALASQGVISDFGPRFFQRFNHLTIHNHSFKHIYIYREREDCKKVYVLLCTHVFLPTVSSNMAFHGKTPWENPGFSMPLRPLQLIAIASSVERS